MKKGLLIIPVLASTLLLGGCGNQVLNIRGLIQRKRLK